MVRLSLFVAISTSLYLVTLSKFYPFGPTYFDTLLSRGDDAIQSIGDLPSPFPFFGELHQRIYVCENELIIIVPVLCLISRL